MMGIMVQALTALIIALVFLLAGYLLGKRKVSQAKKEALQRQRPILGGLFSEQIAPLLPDFPKGIKFSEARFVGKPIDFLFFKGMDEKDITEVVFVEVKTGKSALTFVERKLRDAIRDKRVEWREYRISDEMLHSSEKMEASSAESASAG